MIPMKIANGRIISLFVVAPEVTVGVLVAVVVGEIVNGVFGGTVTVWVLLQSLVSP
jgi:hypothetical protein